MQLLATQQSRARDLIQAHPGQRPYIGTVARNKAPTATGFAQPFFQFLMLLVLCIACNHSRAASNSETPQESPRGSYSGAMDTLYPDWFKTSFMELEEDILEAREEGRRLMLVFHQPGCPYCNAFVERNLAQKDIEALVQDNFDVIEINMWGDREVTSVAGDSFTEKTFSEALGVQFTPTVLMYEDTGELALRLNGYYPPQKFRTALDFVISGGSRDQSFNEYLETLATEAAGNAATPESKATKPPYIDSDGFSGAPVSLADITKQRTPFLLMFEQDDCANCQQLHALIADDAEARELMGQFTVARVDMWANTPVTDLDGQAITARDLASRLNINYAPTMVLFSADGAEVIRSESWLKRFHTQSILDYVASGAWENQPNFQRYLSARADEIRERGIDVNIFD